MNGLILSTPTKLRLNFPDEVIDSVRKHLTFRDSAAQFAYTRFKNNRWYANQHGPEAFQEELNRLKALIVVELIFEDDQGLYTYSGLRDYLRPFLGETRNDVSYPESKPLAYMGTSQKMRPYQEVAVEALMMARHGAIESATGTGKTRCIQELIKRHGLRSVVVTPSTSIARQIYKNFKNIFGVKKVGLFGDGRHDLGKQITVGIAASLTRVEPRTEVAKFFAGVEVLIFDESHTIPSETFKKVCLGVLESAPYRYFVSATQIRNDGKDRLLAALTGPIVFDYPLVRAVNEGFLSKPNFYIHRVSTDTNFYSDDTLEMMRAHIYNNKILHAIAADLANKFVSLCGHQVLILIENITQFSLLIPHLKHETRFVHGGLTAKNKDSVDSRFHKADVETSVDDFNANKFPILVGTSCVGVGTDFKGVNTIIYLQGGKSEIKVSQAVGRGTRMVDGKFEFNFVDFDVDVDCPALRKQVMVRKKIYDSLYRGAIYDV